MVEEAQKAGLRLMLGIPWPFHMAFLDSRDMMREIRDAIRKTVSRRANSATIAAYSIGNEIRSDIVRWHGPAPTAAFSPNSVIWENRSIPARFSPTRTIPRPSISI